MNRPKFDDGHVITHRSNLELAERLAELADYGWDLTCDTTEGSHAEAWRLFNEMWRIADELKKRAR